MVLFTPLNVNVYNKPFISEPINWSEDEFMNCQLTQFDREGYEFLPIEQEYYKAAGIELHHENVFAHESGQKDGWYAISAQWFVQTKSHPNLFLDHSLCVHRAGFDGEAKKQIESYANKRPELRKLLAIKPKWGHDFCLDWIDEEGVTEIIHWEWDFTRYQNFKNHLAAMENLVLNTNWDKHAKTILKKYKGVVMTSEEIGDKKAAALGLFKAFNLYKTI
jgi:hypothetical protein